MKNTLLVIDPYLKYPELEAFYHLSECFSNIKDIQIKNICYVSPVVPYEEMDKLVQSDRIGCVVGLGSDAYVTEKQSWHARYQAWIQSLAFDRKIPFFAICYTHQFIADMFGAKVDFISNRLKSAEITYLDPRKINVIHSSLSKLVENSKSEFYSHVYHSQEVLGIPKGFIKTAESSYCENEAFVHENLPIVTVQCHPEVPHESGDGWRLLQNFIRFSASYWA